MVLKREESGLKKVSRVGQAKHTVTCMYDSMYVDTKDI